MDRDYRTVARAHKIPVDRVKGDDLTQFRIERARLRSSWYFLASTVVSVGGYGWTLAFKTASNHLEVALNAFLLTSCCRTSPFPWCSNSSLALPLLFCSTCVVPC